MTTRPTPSQDRIVMAVAQHPGVRLRTLVRRGMSASAISRTATANRVRVKNGRVWPHLTD